MKPLDQTWPIAQAVELACILEATAPKVGNVHPAARFADMHFGHFVTSAATIATVFADSPHRSVGELILSAIDATRRRVGCNTNLGTVLLLAPLAVAATQRTNTSPPPTTRQLATSTARVLQSLTSEDSRNVYSAIRLAQPGGLGEKTENDIHSEPPDNLLDAMSQVAKQDAVARQYVNGFTDVFETLLPWLREELQRCDDPLQAIVRLQLRWLADQPDGLIVRKLGIEQARQVQLLAHITWQSLQASNTLAISELDSLDRFLREKGNLRNPGTTADLIAATLFCQLICS